MLPSDPRPWLVALTLAASASAQATVLVNTLADLPDANLADGVIDADLAAPGEQRTLRACVQQTCRWGGNWVIQLPDPSYVLGYHPPAGNAGLFVHSGTPALTSMTIEGLLALPSRIDAAGFGASPDQILFLDASLGGTLPPCRVTLRNLHLANGDAGLATGGGIRHNGGDLFLERVVIDSCKGADGGAIASRAALEARDSSFVSCTATRWGGAVRLEAGSSARFLSCFFQADASGQNGGAISGSGTLLEVTGTWFSSCSSGSGGAIRSNTPTFVVGSSFDSCVASGSGGALDIHATLELNDSLVTTSSAQSGGGMNVAGTGLARVARCTFRSNTAAFLGGGVANAGRLEASHSTFALNVATSGGGIRDFGEMHLVNCTVALNEAANGSGLTLAWSPATSTISSTTVALNRSGPSGAGIWSDTTFGAPQVLVTSTLVADNFDVNGLLRNFDGVVPMVSVGPNLDSDGTCALGPGTIQGSLFAPLLGQVGPLGPHGGPTDTCILPPCSYALDGGASVSAQGVPVADDQRGHPRGRAPDIGAFEDPLGASLAYCTAGTSTSGCVPEVWSTGVPSISARTSFVVRVDGVEGQKSGVIFYGVTGRHATPWGTGGSSYLCVKAPLQRSAMQPSGGTAGLCDGAYALDFTQYLASHPSALGQPFVVGQLVDAQAWYRDPPAVKTTNLSGALEWVMCP